jgi:tripartite-type tricarboxylate transporter receptor subunit TctC
MKMISRRKLLEGAAAASLAMPAMSPQAFAQEAWPNRDLRSICGFPPGSGADIFVRFYAKALQERIGRTVITENKVGAFGNIATEYVSKAKPDGYTLFVAPGSSFLAAAPSLFKKLAFDPVNDFEHVTTLAKLPFLLIVAADGPYKDVPGLVKDLKAKGDKGSYGSVANTGLVGSELFKANFDLRTLEIKYKDVGGMFNDLLGGNIAFAHIDPGSAAGQMSSGKVKALATTSRERFKSLPDIPSASEVGITNSDLIAWWSVHVPKGTPKPILDRLEKEFNDIAASEEHLKFAAALGNDPFVGNSAILKELLLKDIKAWADYVKLARIEPL